MIIKSQYLGKICIDIRISLNWFESGNQMGTFNEKKNREFQASVFLRLRERLHMKELMRSHHSCSGFLFSNSLM
jgi:hypothetical protein